MRLHERIGFIVIGLLLLAAFAVGTQNINPLAPKPLAWTAMIVLLVGGAAASFYNAFSNDQWLTRWRRDFPSTAPRSLLLAFW